MASRLLNERPIRIEEDPLCCLVVLGVRPDDSKELVAVRDGPAMAFKLLEAGQDRWRRINARHLVAVVRAGDTFVDGQLLEGNQHLGAYAAGCPIPNF